MTGRLIAAKDMLASQQGSVRAKRKAVADYYKKYPLIQAPLWSASATVVAGKKVRHSSGNLLVCVVGGTTGGSEPTFSATAGIVDNTATWWFTGQKSRLNSDGYPVPTITVSTSNSGFSVLSKFINTPAMSLRPTSPNLVSYAIGTPGPASKAWLFNDGGASDSQGIGGVGYHLAMRVEEFWTDAPKFGIGWWNSPGVTLKLYADGYEIEEDPTPLIAGNPIYYIVDWSTSGRQMRHYRIETTGPNALISLSVDAQSIITPAALDGPLGVWLGDSYGGTVSTYSNAPWEFLSETVMKDLGIRYTRNMHIGGTGYVDAGAFSNCLTVLTNNPPVSWNADLVVTAHGLNDAVTIAAAPATTVAAAQAAWTLQRQQYPNAALIVVGPWPGTSGPSANLINTDAALLAQMQAWADPKSAYISVVAAPNGSVISGTGHIGATTGVGNTDFLVGADGTHLTFSGKYWARRWLVQQISAALESLGY